MGNYFQTFLRSRGGFWNFLYGDWVWPIQNGAGRRNIIAMANKCKKDLKIGKVGGSSKFTREFQTELGRWTLGVEQEGGRNPSI